MKTFFSLFLILQTSFLIANQGPEVAFDIGTGKIKMQIVQVTYGRIKSLYHQSQQIGKPVLDDQNKISIEGKDRILTILKTLKSASECYQPVKYTAIATELFRVALNGQEIASEISKLMEMDVKIISPEVEGILGFLTVIEEWKLDPENAIVLDIGSGSFQITCKIHDQYLSFSLPFGRFPTNDLFNTKDLSPLKIALNSVSPEIINKIQDGNACLIGIGAHPKKILISKTHYNLDDVNTALKTSLDSNFDHTDLILVKCIMEGLKINQIHYLGTKAGNTTGMFIDYAQFKSAL